MKAMVLRKKNEPLVLEERPDPVAGPFCFEKFLINEL